MPLPSILAAKLSKRGIITSQGLKFNERERRRDFKGVLGCPNKNNIYHECNHWCEVHWKGVTMPDPNYMRNMIKLAQKYPLPNNWMEVFDKGIGSFYYWDMETDLVSWLPPKHPKAVYTESAAKIREKRSSNGPAEEERFVFRVEDEKEVEKGRRTKDDKKEKNRDSKEQDSISEKRHRYDNKERNQKRSRRDDIDPMDPAAYSDVPPGSWSDGLESNRSGVDSTASGALYQQRPYPAPGEVLSSNKAQKLKKNVNFGYS